MAEVPPIEPKVVPAKAFGGRRLVQILWRAFLVLLALGSFPLWFLTRDAIPHPIRIATGTEAGLNYHFAVALCDILKTRGLAAQPISSQGSVENREALLSHRADLAVIKAGPVDLEGLEVVAPLYPDVCFFIVRRDRNIKRIQDLKGRKVLLGRPGSGTNEIAITVLNHYGVYASIKAQDRYFGDLADDPAADAAVASTTLNDPALTKLMHSGNFTLLPVDDALALSQLNPFLRVTEIPKGLFSGEPGIPSTPVATIASPALLVSLPGSSPNMIQASLTALYTSRMIVEFPTLYPRSEAATWTLTPLHKASLAFYDPYRGLGTTSAFLSSLIAIKELFLGLAACMWLGWARYKAFQAKAAQADLARQKEHLDLFIWETIRMEDLLLTSLQDRQALEKLFVDVSQLKLQALNELTHEGLRGDRGFGILLTQCRDLVDKVQHALAMLQRRGQS